MAAVAYLTLPLLIFVLTWLRPWAATIFGLLLLTPATIALSKDRAAWLWSRGTLESAAPWRLAAMSFSIAVGWVCLSGLMGVNTLNDDWFVRLNVLRDLSVSDWPVSYAAITGDPHRDLLRAPLGYYIVPAWMGHHFGGWPAAFAAQAVWTTLGAWLFLWLCAAPDPSRADSPDHHPFRRASVFLVVAILFSGMDLVGQYLNWAHPPEFGEHIEWWARMFQYSSHTTLLFWVPNHALPGWIAGVVAWRHRRSGLNSTAAMALFVTGTFWSPLASFGSLPLLAALVWQAHGPSWSGFLQVLRPWAIWAMMPVLALLLGYMASGDNPGVALQHDESVPYVWWPDILFFTLLEWFIYALIVWRMGEKSPGMIACGLTLLVLPAFRFGPGNDLVMRGAIASITFLALGCADVIVQGWREIGVRHPRRLNAYRMMFFLSVGAVTPVLEIERGFIPGPDHMPHKVFVKAQGTPWHYIGYIQNPILASIFRPPVPFQEPTP